MRILELKEQVVALRVENKRLLHGAQSTQLKAFLDGCTAISKNTTGAGNAAHHLHHHAHGAIRNAIAEVEGGLIVGLRAQVAGEIFSELVGLGKEVLEDDTESAKNVFSRLDCCCV